MTGKGREGERESKEHGSKLKGSHNKQAQGAASFPFPAAWAPWIIDA